MPVRLTAILVAALHWLIHSSSPSVMKLQHLRFAFGDEINPASSSSSLSFNFKRLRPLAPKAVATDGGGGNNITPSLDLVSFDSPKGAKCTQVVQGHNASPSGGTRWNPTQEQIRVLEELYKSGMRTPNAQQIDKITNKLGKYGRIEGKNVFYWFQNHKARERQRQKRAAAAALDASPDPILSLFSCHKVEIKEDELNFKRKYRSWDLEEGDGTLELFPLHPEITCKKKDY